MHVKVHLETALGTGGTRLQLAPHEAENKLPAAHNTPETLFSRPDMTVFIHCFRFAHRAFEFVCEPHRENTFLIDEIVRYLCYTGMTGMLHFC
jgi:hypothetical protein